MHPVQHLTTLCHYPSPSPPGHAKQNIKESCAKKNSRVLHEFGMQPAREQKFEFTLGFLSHNGHHPLKFPNCKKYKYPSGRWKEKNSWLFIIIERQSSKVEYVLKLVLMYFYDKPHCMVAFSYCEKLLTRNNYSTKYLLISTSESLCVLSFQLCLTSRCYRGQYVWPI